MKWLHIVLISYTNRHLIRFLSLVSRPQTSRQGHHFIAMFWNNPQALTDDEMQATASSFFLPLPLFPVAFFLSLSQPIFQPFISSLSPEPHLDLKSSISKDWRGSLPQLRGGHWLRGACNRQATVASSVRKLCYIYIRSTWLMWWKRAETRLKSRFSTFPATIPWPCSQHLFDCKIYLLTTLAEDLGNPNTAGLTAQQELTRSWWFSLEGKLSYMKIFVPLVPFSYSRLSVF